MAVLWNVSCTTLAHVRSLHDYGTKPRTMASRRVQDLCPTQSFVEWPLFVNSFSCNWQSRIDMKQHSKLHAQQSIGSIKVTKLLDGAIPPPISILTKAPRMLRLRHFHDRTWACPCPFLLKGPGRPWCSPSQSGYYEEKNRNKVPKKGSDRWFALPSRDIEIARCYHPI